MGWDPRTNSPEKSRDTIETVQNTNDNVGAHLFGRVVDVDIDVDNPILMEALDYFLPATPHIYGRPSRPKTHRLYELSNEEFDPGNYPFLTKIIDHPDLKLEIRGGEMKSGRYSLLPGSVHPSGEMYEWEDLRTARTSPVFVDGRRLIDGVRFALVTTLLVPYWAEGTRNELCKALSGFLHRAASYNDELAMDMPLTKQKSEELLRGVIEIADDDESDIPARLKTFEQTWEKADLGEPVLGATHIQNITKDDRLLPLLYSILAQTADLQLLDELFEKYAVIRNTTNVVDLTIGTADNYVMNKDAFVFTLQGQNIETQKGRVPVSMVFLNSLQRTIVDRLTVRPDADRIYEIAGKKVANLWDGWEVPPYEGEVTDEEMQPIIHFLKEVVCSGDEKLYEWVKNWIADIFKNPSSKTGTALTLVGKQGAGKSIIGEKILRPIIGEAHSAQVGSVERLTSKFNKGMAGKLLVMGEEVISAKRRIDADTLKDVITAKKRTIELKGRDSFEMDDFARYLFTSNHTTDAVHIEVGDRRYTVVLVNDYYAYIGKATRTEKQKYWSALHKFLEERDNVPHKENLAKVHRWFLQQEYARSMLRDPYETAAKQANLQSSSGGMDGWLISMYEMNNPFDGLTDNERGYHHSLVMRKNGTLEGTNDWPEYVPYNLLEFSFTRYARGKRIPTQSAQQIATFFRTEGLLVETEPRKARVHGKRLRVRPMPSRQVIFRYLQERGYNVEEDREEDTPDDEHEEF